MTHSFEGLCMLLISGVLSFTLSCAEIKLPDGLKDHAEVEEFLLIANKQDIDPAMRYTALEPVIAIAREAEELDWLASQLGRVLEKNPHDPYGSYYLMAMANGALDTGSNELALEYMRRLLKNYPNLLILGQSLHLLALREIAIHTTVPHEAVSARDAMQSRFPNRIDRGKNHYYLANEYKKIGEWDRMFDSYRNFLNYPESEIPGIPDAHTNVMDALRFHSSNKTWTKATLDDLINIVKYSIRTQNVELLQRHQSDNFFFMNWSQETSDSFTHIPMSLGTFLSERVRFKQELDDYSNDREAFLWTVGWTWKIPTWYLYFRRIDYPMNPEINGRWEWTGIYFGERL